MSELSLAPPALEVRLLDGGGMLLRSPIELEPYSRSMVDMLAHWTVSTPDKVLYGERGPDGGWRVVSYREAWAAARSIGEALLGHGLSAERPLLILAPNSIDHALLVLGAMCAGVPVAPVAPAYALNGGDYAKLKYVVDLVGPGMIYLANARDYAPAMAALEIGGALIAAGGDTAELGAITFSSLLDTIPGPAIDHAFAAITPDTVAKILLTSGSTGMPKGVINTQRMLCSNQQAWSQLYHFLSERPPVLLDWLPWNHTFGGNNNFGLVLRHGGTLYLDSGKPLQGQIERTVANLRDVAPSVYFNVPGGYDMLLPYLENDKQLRTKFFSRLGFLCYAGASLSQRTWNSLQAMSVAARGKPILIVSAWGATETAPGATTVYFPTTHHANIGLPIPGVELKMVPNGDKLEMRVRGPNVTPGYWKREELTRAAFDEEGFYRMGDAGRLIDPDDPTQGVAFDGRIGEDFKLSSGTWVDVGGLRQKVVAAGAPLIDDVVIAGHDQERIGLLIFPNERACRVLCPELSPDYSLAALLRDVRVRARLNAALTELADRATGAAARPARALVMDEAPSADAGEITEKRYINQRAVLQRRAASVARLYADQPDADVLLLVR